MHGEVAANFTVVGPAAPKKSGRPLRYAGLCNTISLGLACRGSQSPLCGKDSGVACVLPHVDVVSLYGHLAILFQAGIIWILMG